MEMFCTGRKMSVREAASRGLVTQVLDGAKFEERVEAQLNKLADVSTSVSKDINQFPLMNDGMME